MKNDRFYYASIGEAVKSFFSSEKVRNEQKRPGKMVTACGAPRVERHRMLDEP